MATHSTIYCLKDSKDRGAWQAMVYRVCRALLSTMFVLTSLDRTVHSSLLSVCYEVWICLFSLDPLFLHKFFTGGYNEKPWRRKLLALMALKVVNVNGLELEAFSTQWFQGAGEWSKRLSRLWLDFQSSNHINAIWSNPRKEQLKHKSCHCPELPGFTAWVDSICFKQGQTWVAPTEKSEWFCLIAWTLYVCAYAHIYTHIYIYISSQKLMAWCIFLNTHVFSPRFWGSWGDLLS